MRDRVVEFPGKNWDFLLNTARNCAAAFDVVHATGAVMGDVNERNFLVQPNGMVALIDCDSYQIRERNDVRGHVTWAYRSGHRLSFRAKTSKA